MKFIVRNLQLNRSICVPSDSPAPDGTTAIYAFRSLVGANNLEPRPTDHLAHGERVGEIPSGFYLFAQGTAEGPGTGVTLNEPEPSWRDAAEAVWLESLWQEAKFKNDRVLVRILSEDEKSVFQIFREVFPKD